MLGIDVILQELRKPEDARQRGPEFVADVGQESLFQLGHAFGLGLHLGHLVLIRLQLRGIDAVDGDGRNLPFAVQHGIKDAGDRPYRAVLSRQDLFETDRGLGADGPPPM